MRVTNKMMHNQFISNLNRNLRDLLKLQEQISSGKKVNKPSDDPVAASRIVAYKDQLSGIEDYKNAIDTAKNSLTSIDTALSSLGNALIRARELGTEGASGSMGADARASIASELDELIKSAVDIGNTKVGDRYIFAGYRSGDPPIETLTGEFTSDGKEVEVDIGPFAHVAINAPAGKLFSFKRYSPTDPSAGILPSYNWDNGGAITFPDADPSSALYTDSGGFSAPTDVFSAGGGTLTITSGPGNSSPVNVAIPPGATLNDVRDAINGGAAGVKAQVVDFGKPPSSDYRIVLASDPPGGSGSITLQVASPDPPGLGLNRLAFDPKGTSNMTLSENVTNYNYISDPENPNYYSFNNNYLNGKNVLRALHFLKDALKNNDAVRIGKAIQYIDSASDSLSQVRAEVGARINRVDLEETIHNDMETRVKAYLSHEQDTNIPDAVASLQQKETALQAFRTISVNLLNLSLFDFLR